MTSNQEERLAAQAGAAGEGALPDGVHRGVLEEVEVIPRKKGGFWLRLIGTTHGGRSVPSTRKLGDGDDPWELSPARLKSLQEFTARLGAEPASDPQGCVDKIAISLVGEPIQIKVHRDPKTGSARYNFTGDNGVVIANEDRALTTQGEVVELRPPVEESLETAQEASGLITQGLGAARLALSAVAKGCYMLRETKGWKALGLSSLEEFLAQPEITMKRTEFYRYALVWERFVVTGGIDPDRLAQASTSKLDVVLPALAKGTVDPETAIADAVALTREDLRVKYSGDNQDADVIDLPVKRCKACQDLTDEILESVRRVPAPVLLEFTAPYGEAEAA